MSEGQPETGSRVIEALPPFTPDLCQRAWSSTPHPTLPLLATTHDKSVTIFSLSTFSSHSSLTGGHERSVRSATWKPGLPPHKLCLVSGSFDSTLGLWRWKYDVPLEDDVAAAAADSDDDDGDDWKLIVVLEGQEHEIKCVAFSPSGSYLATCSRDKSIWIWEDVGASEEDDDWETVAVLSEHEGDVKCVAWCPDVPGRAAAKGRYGADVLASASYDNTVRIWREDGDGEWVCVSVLEGHDGIVWGVQWEPSPKSAHFPRLMSWSSDLTVRIWSLHDDDDDNDGHGHHSSLVSQSALGGIPNTMRRSLRETWQCTAVLPRAHTRDIYSAAWSPVTGLVASTGGDGVVALYREDAVDDDRRRLADAAAELDGDAHDPMQPSRANPGWTIVETLPNAHGPYEINNIAWCRRFDPASEKQGVDSEMVVTTGDDGVIRPWAINLERGS